MHTVFFNTETNTFEFTSSSADPSKEVVYDPEKYELRWAVIQFSDVQQVDNKLIFSFDKIRNIHSLPPSQENINIIKQAYREQVKSNENNLNARACMAYIAIPRQEYYRGSIDRLYEEKNLAIENIHTEDEDTIPIIPLHVTIQGINNHISNRFNPNYRLSEVRQNTDVPVQFLTEQPLNYYTIDGSPITGKDIINAQNNPTSPGYQVDGGWFAGLEALGGRSTQEDTMIAVSLTPEDNMLYVSLNEKEKKSLLNDTTKELADKLKEYENGSTGIITIIEPESSRTLTANLGDSQVFSVIVNQNNELINCKRLNTLHNPSVPSEDARILAQFPDAPFCNRNGRLWGVLALSRAFGDRDFEQYGLSTEPELILREHKLKENEEIFFVVACDGLTEKISESANFSQERGEYLLEEYLIGNFIAKNRSQSLKDLCSDMKKTIACHSEDNISILICKLTPNVQGTTKIFGVFDGHGGVDVSQYLRENWFKTFQKHLNLIYQNKNQAQNANTSENPAKKSRGKLF